MARFRRLYGKLAIHRIEEASNSYILAVTSGGLIEWDGAHTIAHPEIAAELDVKPDEVSHVLEDSHGVTWFCTRKGVARRIGNSIEKLRPYDHEGHGATRVYEDPQGNVWFFKEDGLYRATADGLELAFSRGVIHISEDSRGTLWLSTRNGLFRLNPNRRGMKRYIHDPTDPSSLGDSEIISTGEDGEGNFWVGTRVSLDKFDRETGKVTHHIQVGDSGVGLRFHEDRLGVFWVIYGSLGQIATVDRKTERLTRYEFEWKNGGAQVNQAYSMLEDSDGTMWFGTAAAG
jgi:ligand-binding sensor domain-containing protein